MQKNLKRMSRQYANKAEPDLRRNGAKWAGIVFGGLLTFELLLSTCLLWNSYKDYGVDFKEEWCRERKEGFARDLIGPGVFAILAYLVFGELAVMGTKEEAKRFMETVMKRYARKFRIDTSKCKDKCLRDAADLIIANMTQEDRESVVDLGVALDAKLGAISMKNMAAREREIWRTVSDVSNVINSVLNRNPDLEGLIVGIITGKTKYNPKLVEEMQKHK